MRTATELMNPIFALRDAGYLEFGDFFDDSLEDVEWPKRLETIEYCRGSRFNQPIDFVEWPASLRRLEFGWDFNQPIENARWPASLHELSLGRSEYRGDDRMAMFSNFDQHIGNGGWPASLRRLTLGGQFDQSLEGLGTWMPNLEELRLLCYGFGTSLREIEWPKGLRQLTVYKESIRGAVIPSTVQVVYRQDVSGDY
ncbi:unnamed protein product [Ectocarpus sp. 8 AP-2014]